MAVSPEWLYERLDDVPLILGVAGQLRLAEVLDRHLGNHALNQGLSYGRLAVGWLAYVLSQGDHAKYQVRDWALGLPHTLAHFFGQPVRDTDFSDDRLGTVLRRLAKADWHGIEAGLWQATLDVYELPLAAVRLDSTTDNGHHQVHPGGLMQFGRSKDGSGLPQLKIMAGAAQPQGHVLACDVHPGQCADDPLYVPLIHRLRDLTGKTGLLYAGDSKMAALATRADVVAGDDYYLCRLPRTNDNGALIDGWVEQLLSGAIASSVLRDDEGEEVGLAGEVERELQAEHEGEVLVWRERVQLIRPRELWQHHQGQLEKRLVKAEQALAALTPPATAGRKQAREEGQLAAAVEAVLARYEVKGLLAVSWCRQEQRVRRKGKPEEVLPRYQITEVRRKEEELRRARERLSWQVQVSNVPEERLDLRGCVLGYGQGYCLEQDWHWLKNRPLGLSPLWVWKDDQLLGLVRLLMLALRLLTYIQLRARAGLAQGQEELRGTYAGQAGRRDKAPTAARLLESLSRARISLIGVREGAVVHWRLTEAPALLGRLLAWLGLPARLYADLAEGPRARPTRHVPPGRAASAEHGARPRPIPK
jgi:transposase